MIRYSGLPVLFREIVQKKKVTILLFHDLSRDQGEKIFHYLTKKYQIISLKEYIGFCTDNLIKKIQDKSMIITFDDGFKGNHDLLGTFRKFQIPATIFICSGLINTHRHLWFEENKTGFSIEKLNKMSNTERLKILSENGYILEREYEEPQLLNRKQMEEMKGSVDFQSHTIFHPSLPGCTLKEADEEISASKKHLEDEYGYEIFAFAYPNGDYSEREIDLIKKAGYQCALTVDSGFNTCKSDVFRLKRLCVNDPLDINELIVKASGLWDFFKPQSGFKRNRHQ